MLQQSLESYLATVDGPFELIVIDDASPERSREIIERCRGKLRSLKTILLRENLGGETNNLALEQAINDLIHIAENGQPFVDGCSHHVRNGFAAFAGLEQHSVHVDKFARDPRGISAGAVQRPRIPPAPGEAGPNSDCAGAKSSSRRRAAILVLGVHRSGTSCLAQLLNVLGAVLPAEVLAPAPSNPFGHWEPVRLLEINEEILSAIGRTWYDSRPIPNGWFRSKAAYGFRERLRSLIASEYGDADLILIKEPRICRLVPLYLDALAALGIEPLAFFLFAILEKLSGPLRSGIIFVL